MCCLPVGVCTDKDPVVFLLQDAYCSMSQGEGLTGAIGAYYEDGRQLAAQVCGHGNYGLLLLQVQPVVQLLIPLSVFYVYVF